MRDKCKDMLGASGRGRLILHPGKTLCSSETTTAAQDVSEHSDRNLRQGLGLFFSEIFIGL